MRKLEVVFLEKDKIDRFGILQMVRTGKSVRYQTTGENFMLIEQQIEDFISVGMVTYVQVSYMSHETDAETGKSHWVACQTEFFDPEQAVKAVDCFVTRMLSNQPHLALDTGTTVEAIKIRKSGIVSIKNHYHYLDAAAPFLWPLLFGKTMEEMHCGGIVTAHGDKCYGYRHEWESKGIPFNRAALVYLLSYTQFFEDSDRSDICQWVIDRARELLPKLIEAENQAEAKYRL